MMDVGFHFSQLSGIVTGDQKTKAIKLNDLKLIRPVGPGKWIMEPIEGYNKSQKIVAFNGDEWRCTCFYNTRYGKAWANIYAFSLFEHKLVNPPLWSETPSEVVPHG